jgi:hypothetical protein
MADMYVQKDLQQRTITKEVIRRRQVHECAAENSIPLHRIELSWPARVHEQCSYQFWPLAVSSFSRSRR